MEHCTLNERRMIRATLALVAAAAALAATFRTTDGLASSVQVAPDVREILARALHRTIQRILHPVATNLRKAAGADSARSQVAALRKLFERDDPDRAK